MSIPNTIGNCTSHNQDKKPTTDINSHHTLSPANSPTKHLAIDATAAAPEHQDLVNPVPLQQQRPRPSFEVAHHHGWDASNVSTAKCDLCHRQRCGTLQKCRVCKLSICRECCVGGRLQSDRSHAIDAAAVDWDVPPNPRKRKRRAAEGEEEVSLVPKRQKANVRRGRGRGRGGRRSGPETPDASGDILASSVVVSDETAQATAGDVPRKSAARFREHGRADPMEPRLSVAPVSYYASIGRPQHMDATSPKYSARFELETASSSYETLPASEEACNEDEERLASLDGERYPDAFAPGELSHHPASPANDFSRDAASRPVLPPITPLLRDRRMRYYRSSETFQNSSEILSRLDHLLSQHQHQHRHHHHEQSITNESWPPHDHTDSLGTSLANAAHATHHASSPRKPLDHCLRDELQAVWTSRAFVSEDPDAGRRYRRLLAAAYFASTCLDLEPRENAAREWLCGEERRMREMGCEPTKTAQLLDFLQEVGIWYLRQAQH